MNTNKMLLAIALGLALTACNKDQAADSAGEAAQAAGEAQEAATNAAATGDAQAVGVADQAEFRRVPVQAREIGQRLRADAVRLDPAAAVGLHVVGEHRVHQQRHVAEQVVEQVRFGQVVHLLGRADPPRDREAPVREMVEEVELGQQALHADQLPTSGRAQHLVEVVELRDLVRAHVHGALRVEERLAGAADQDLLLALEQLRPDVVVDRRIAGPGLLDHGRGVDGHVALVGELVLDALRLGVHGGPPADAPI